MPMFFSLYIYSTSIVTIKAIVGPSALGGKQQIQASQPSFQLHKLQCSSWYPVVSNLLASCKAIKTWPLQ